GEASARRAVELAPGEGLAHLQLALSLGAGPAVFAAIDRAIALEPANGSFLVQRAMMRLSLGDADGARADADAARRLEAAPIQLALLAVEESVLAGDEPANFAAMAQLKDQLAGWPKELMAWIYLGVALEKDEVMPSYQAMLARHPTHPYLAMTSALIAERAGRIDESLAIALACRERHPHHAQAGLMVVVYQGSSGAHEAALATARTIPEAIMTPQDRFLMRRLVLRSLIALGRSDEARAQLTRTQQDFPDRAAQLGDVVEALR
ncbi:MAG: hypothetical protein H0X45_10655, partial [Planctomycetes bacterium]|nr:hypothetical protein [Planctomycetota bacterium]